MMKETSAVAHPVQPPAIDTRKVGMWLFLVSEVMFFSGLISAAINMKMRSPADANHALNVPVTAINTFVLICSSTAVVMALSALQDGRKRTAIRWMIATAIMGSIFVGVQINEYILLFREGFTPQSSLFAGGFFAVTSFHGFHVFLGVCVLIWLIARTIRGSVNARHYMPFEGWGLYWHFVDIVWILLFTILYLL